MTAWAGSARFVPYARLYGGRAYAPKSYQNRITALVRELAANYGMNRRPVRARHRDVPRPHGKVRSSSP